MVPTVLLVRVWSTTYLIEPQHNTHREQGLESVASQLEAAHLAGVRRLTEQLSDEVGAWGS